MNNKADKFISVMDRLCVWRSWYEEKEIEMQCNATKMES